MQKLKTVDSDTLLYQPLEKPCFLVVGLIPTGLSLFCGSQKIGKSRLMLKLCLCVSEGIPLWELPTAQGDVLYLCLEDTFYRIQDRLFKLTDEAGRRLHFADKYSLAVLVVHHIRKQKDSDVFNQVSGTAGLTGGADTNFVLEKTNRTGDTATLYVTGRDIEYQEFTLRFCDCSWELVERKEQRQLVKEAIPPVLFRLVSFMQDKEKWSGTATEL